MKKITPYAAACLEFLLLCGLVYEPRGRNKTMYWTDSDECIPHIKAHEPLLVIRELGWQVEVRQFMKDKTLPWPE